MKKVRQRRILKRLWRFSKNLFVGFVFLVILAWVLLQNEGVQNWLVKRIASNLSERMETKIELDRVSFGLFDRLSLEGFYMEDLEGDTLIYSQRLNTSLSANLIGLIRKRIDVDDVALENAQVNLKKGPGEAKNNLSILQMGLMTTENCLKSMLWML